jgi:hypothetical protein
MTAMTTTEQRPKEARRVIVHDGPDGTKTIHAPTSPCAMCDAHVVALTRLLDEHGWDGDETDAHCVCGLVWDNHQHVARLLLAGGWLRAVKPADSTLVGTA